jgi:hydrogenase-4 component B
MSAFTGLWCSVGLLLVALVRVALGGSRQGTSIVYGASLILCLLTLIAALAALLGGAPDATFAMPLGVPWIGAHFRLDPLAAFLLIIVNLGGAITSLYALGSGRHEDSPLRVLPFYPGFLADMNLAVCADDAFTFLFSWELMSLASWAIVMAHYHHPANQRAGYIYLVMARFGTLCLLLAFGLLAGPDGGYAFATVRAFPLTALIAALATSWLCSALDQRLAWYRSMFGCRSRIRRQVMFPLF